MKNIVEQLISLPNKERYDTPGNWDLFMGHGCCHTWSIWEGQLYSDMQCAFFGGGGVEWSIMGVT